jgi:hypothetical protein
MGKAEWGTWKAEGGMGNAEFRMDRIQELRDLGIEEAYRCPL